jgi:UDPglucose 6-dehydrogenase
MNNTKTKIGFIGQGWIGRHLADNFEERGYETIRFAKEPEFEGNLDRLAEAEIVFVAVPTPTTPEGFDATILRSVLKLAKQGQTLVVKSTILPGTTDAFAAENPGVFIMHSPEFLREASVKEDIAYPDRNIIGIPSQHFNDPIWKKKADTVMVVLPDAPYNIVCTAPEAEMTKYGGNNFLYVKVVFMNILYDLAMKHGARWDIVAKNIGADPRIGNSHMMPVHQHDHMGKEHGRGAGGHCFIKDFAAMREIYEKELPDDTEGIALLRAFEKKNNRLLSETKKDLDLLRGVYGEQI